MTEDSPGSGSKRSATASEHSKRWTISSDFPQSLRDSAWQTYRDLAYLCQEGGYVSIQASALSARFALILGDYGHALSLFRRLAADHPWYERAIPEHN